MAARRPPGVPPRSPLPTAMDRLCAELRRALYVRDRRPGGRGAGRCPSSGSGGTAAGDQPGTDDRTSAAADGGRSRHPATNRPCCRHVGEWARPAALLWRETALMLAVVLAVYTVGEMLASPAQSAAIAAAAPVGRSGVWIAAVGTSYSAGYAVAPAAGLALHRRGTNVLWLTIIAAGLLSATLFGACLSGGRSPTSPTGRIRQARTPAGRPEGSRTWCWNVWILMQGVRIGSRCTTAAIPEPSVREPLGKIPRRRQTIAAPPGESTTASRPIMWTRRCRVRYPRTAQSLPFSAQPSASPRHGAKRIRTADLLGAIQALSQLSYSPARAEVYRRDCPAQAPPVGGAGGTCAQRTSSPRRCSTRSSSR